MTSLMLLLPLLLLLNPAACAPLPPHLLALGTAYLDMDAPMAGAHSDLHIAGERPDDHLLCSLRSRRCQRQGHQGDCLALPCTLYSLAPTSRRAYRLRIFSFLPQVADLESPERVGSGLPACFGLLPGGNAAAVCTIRGKCDRGGDCDRVRVLDICQVVKTALLLCRQ